MDSASACWRSRSATFAATLPAISLSCFNQSGANLAKRGCLRHFSFPQPGGLGGGGPCGHPARNQLGEFLRRAAERLETRRRELADHVLRLERRVGSGGKLLDHRARRAGGCHQAATANAIDRRPATRSVTCGGLPW